MLGSQTGAQVNDPVRRQELTRTSWRASAPVIGSSASGSSWRTAGTGHPDRSEGAGGVRASSRRPKTGITRSMAVMARIRADSRTGDDEPDFAAFSPGAPTGRRAARAARRSRRSESASCRPRRFPSLCGRREQGGPEPSCVGNVDLFGGDHHWRASSASRFPWPRRLCAAAPPGNPRPSPAWSGGCRQRAAGELASELANRGRAGAVTAGTNRVGPGASVTAAARGWSGLSTGLVPGPDTGDLAGALGGPTVDCRLDQTEDRALQRGGE